MNKSSFLNKKFHYQFRFLILAILTFTSPTFAEIAIEYPDLSDAKPIIIERQRELFSQLQDARMKKSDHLISEAYGKLAEFYYVHEYVDASIPLFKNAIEFAQMNAKWYYLLGIAYKSKGEFEKVITYLEKAWELNDRYLPVMNYLGEIYLQQGLLDKAQNAFNAVLKQDEHFSRALVGLGQVFMQQGKPEQAIENYKQALKYQPSATQVNFLLSSAYAATGDMKSSKEYHAKKGIVQAQMFDPIISEMYEESRSYTYYNNKAVQAYKTGDFKTAETLANTARNYDPSSPYPKVTLANIYTSTGRVQKAIDIMQEAEKDNKEIPSFKYILGIIEEINGKNDKAISWYQEVLKLDPYHKKALLNLSNALMRKGAYESALQQLQKLQDLEPENPNILYKQASIHAHQKKCQSATKEIYSAVKLQPKNFSFLLTLVKIAVHCNVDSQVLKDALNAARNMYQYSQNTYVVETLAMIEAKNNNFTEAIDYQAQAIFQLLADKKNDNGKKIIQLKTNLELYKKGKYPLNLFNKDDIDLYPRSFKKIK